MFSAISLPGNRTRLLSMTFLLLLSFLALLSSLPNLNAYYIDPSCSGANRDLVRTAADSAFDMAASALQALQTSPRDDNVNRLISLLFCGPGEDPATKNLKKLDTAYKGIVAESRLGDEPFNSLDVDTRNRVVSLVRRAL